MTNQFNVGDVIEFTYHGTRRVAEVVETHANYVTTQSRDWETNGQYKSYSFDKMTGIMQTEEPPHVYSLRVSGSNDYVSRIDPDDDRCYPKGSVDCVVGKQNADTLRFADFHDAVKQAEVVERLEGFFVTIERD